VRLNTRAATWKRTHVILYLKGGKEEKQPCLTLLKEKRGGAARQELRMRRSADRGSFERRRPPQPWKCRNSLAGAVLNFKKKTWGNEQASPRGRRKEGSPRHIRAFGVFHQKRKTKKRGREKHNSFKGIKCQAGRRSDFSFYFWGHLPPEMRGKGGGVFFHVSQSGGKTRTYVL